MNIASFALLSCFLLSGTQACSSWDKGDTAHVLIAQGFNVPQQELIKDAVTSWGEALDHYIYFEYVESTEYDNLITIEREPLVILQQEHNPGCAGYTNWRRDLTGGEIKIADDIPNQDFSIVAKHELGHALGLSHTQNRPAIMFPDVLYSNPDITCEDVSQFCMVWSCGQEFSICARQRFSAGPRAAGAGGAGGN